MSGHGEKGFRQSKAIHERNVSRQSDLQAAEHRPHRRPRRLRAGVGGEHILLYLFTGDTIWFGVDGGYSFISTLAEDNRLAVRSLEKLEANLRARKRRIAVITGHTGWTDDLDFAFAHRTEICKPFTKKYTDPEAPYDGYVEDDDTEANARAGRLKKKEAKR